MILETAIDWEKPTSEEAVAEEVEQMLLKNVPLRNPGKHQPKVLGFPVGEPDPFGVAMQKYAMDFNPNNIGLHTTGKKAEYGFEGTQEAERRFISMVAELLGTDLNHIDGYIESGGSHANWTGLCIGRNRTNKSNKDGNPIKNCKNKAAVLCSHLTHHSISQGAFNAGIGVMTSIGKDDGTGIYALGTDEDGHLLLGQLEQKIRDLVRVHPEVSNIIVVGNAGTTMLGSVDNIAGINEMLGQLKRKYSDKIFHFHIDAAHGGLLTPFLSNTSSIGFQHEHVDTICVDPHKMGKVGFGCGVMLARKNMLDHIEATNCHYINEGSKMMIGSRPGAIAVGAYATFKKRGREGLAAYAHYLRHLTWDVRSQLDELGIDIFSSDLNIVAVKGALPEELREHYIVHTHKRMPKDMSKPDDEERRSVWNIVVMEHVEEHMKSFEQEYKKYTQSSASHSPLSV